MKRRKHVYSTPDNARRAAGEPANWPPSDVAEESIECPACGWKGAVYFTVGAPPPWIHCPSPADDGCAVRIPIPGGSRRTIELGATAGWFIPARPHL